jgi:hypothetical protein
MFLWGWVNRRDDHARHLASGAAIIIIDPISSWKAHRPGAPEAAGREFPSGLDVPLASDAPA